MEELEAGEMEYETVEEFLTVLKKEFSGGEKESVKVVELRKMEQGERTIEEFVQEFKRVARESRYEGRLLMEEFKKEMNGGIRRKLIKAENLLTSIEQWYRRATALDRNKRESRRKEERLRGKKKTAGGGIQKQERQSMPQPLVWQRRQLLPQQATMGPAPIEGIEKMNAVVVRGSEARAGQNVGVPPRWDSYAMEVNRGRNCYACGGFGHMACHCRNRGRGRPIDGRRVEYGGERFEGNIEQIGHLKEVENLEALD